jgi:hypothetical protein
VRNDDSPGKRRSRDARVSWDCLDHAPAPIRRALQEAVVDWCPVQCMENIKARLARGERYATAVAAEVEVLIYEDEQDIAAFAAARWPARFGPYPHLAANATIQRYGRRR